MEVYCPQRHWAVSEDICDHLDYGISRAEARAAVPPYSAQDSPTAENEVRPKSAVLRLNLFRRIGAGECSRTLLR